MDYQLTSDLRDMLDSINPLVKEFRMAGERIRTKDDQSLKLKLIGTRTRDGRDYNLPTGSEVAALIVGDFDETKNKRDIILHRQDGDLKRISELHPSYLAMQYPLLFPYAEDGYRTNIFHFGVTDYDEKNKGTRVTMKEYFAYRIQERPNEFSMMLNGRRLFQQFIVDGYTMIESERMSFNKKNNKELRSETYSRLAKLAENPESGVKLRGRKVVLPSSFTGSPRYMMQNYLDAMTICKFYGYPDLFITFTCNPNWPEINRFMAARGLKSEDRPDVITRVFKIKLDCLMHDLKERRTFGRVKGGNLTIHLIKILLITHIIYFHIISVILMSHISKLDCLMLICTIYFLIIQLFTPLSFKREDYLTLTSCYGLGLKIKLPQQQILKSISQLKYQIRTMTLSCIKLLQIT